MCFGNIVHPSCGTPKLEGVLNVNSLPVLSGLSHQNHFDFFKQVRVICRYQLYAGQGDNPTSRGYGKASKKSIIFPSSKQSVFSFSYYINLLSSFSQ